MAHKKNNLAKLFGCISLISSKSALALDMSYYTYDGFSQTVDAFKKIALIFADKEYIILFTIFAILGILIGGIVSYGKSMTGIAEGAAGRISLSFLILPILGTVVFKGMIVPKGNIHIYDEKINAYEKVSGVPALIVLAAGVMNKVERTVVRVIGNSSASPYTKDAGGLGFKMLYDVTNNPAEKIDFYLIKSLKQYYGDCHSLALANTTNSFNLSHLRSKSTNLMTDMSQLKNPAAWTTYFSETNKKGELVSCETAWDSKLKPLLNSDATLAPLLNSVCQKNHFDNGNAVQLQSCHEALDRAIKLGYGAQPGYATFLRNSIIASSIANAIQDENPDVGVRALTNRAMLNEGVGVAVAAENWFPTIKAVVTAIILGLLPILLLFMVTPLFPKVLNMTFSLFAWITLWGIIDAFLHQSTTEQMINAFSVVTTHNMGLLAFWNAPESAMKAMAIMGQARGMGIMIATFLAGSLFGLNAYAFSSIAERWSSRVDSEGSKAAELTQSPQHSADYVDSLARANATHAAFSNYGFDSMSSAATFSKSSNLSSDLTATSMTTGEAMSAGHSIGGIQGAAQAGNMAATAANNVNGLANTSYQTAMTETGVRISDARGLEQAAANLGISGGAAGISGLMTQIDKQMSYGQTMSNETMANLIKQDNPGMSEQQAWQSLGLYYGSDKVSDINATTGNVSDFIRYKTDVAGLNMAETSAYLDTVAQLGFSPTELRQAQAQYSAAQEAGIASAFDHIEPGMLVAGRALSEIRQGYQGSNMMSLAEANGGINNFASMLAQNDTATDFARANALLSAANGLGLTPTQTALSREGANWSMALDASQTEQLYSKGLINQNQSNALANGGVLNFGFSATDGFSMTTASAHSGFNASVDNGMQLNSQTSIMRGAYTGGGTSGIEATTNAHDIETILSTDNGRRNLAMNAANALSSVYDIRNSTIDSMSWNASLNTPGHNSSTGQSDYINKNSSLSKIVSGGAGISTGSLSQQTQSIDPVIGVYSNMIDAIYAEADQRGYSDDMKQSWVANEFATLNSTIYDKFNNLAVDQAGDANFNFAVSEYFGNRGLNTAAKSIETHWMSYKYGATVNEEFLVD